MREKEFIQGRDLGDETPQLPAEPIGPADVIGESNFHEYGIPCIPPTSLPLTEREAQETDMAFLRRSLERTQKAYEAQSKRSAELLKLVQEMDMWLIGTAPMELIEKVDRALGKDVPAKSFCEIGGAC